ncbi:winged helix-turn-helix domain-containing protein [Thalassotalea marina]|uniref:OmpR/PhoB-type domain-containing protein n=1 Tax=Thalassotalea marina TaxID=1673741 RepID=A0A919BEV5_9GAMM|nr:winged helix-turn-helix domain-containing protein [Thalassotalea marina]GHF84245.1 hypothetical protein GCM10017161_09550 [Thalassotalea marina]
MPDSSFVVTAPKSEVYLNEEFHFGEFVFNSSCLILMKNGEELSVEPQVLELLHFLIKNDSRYILTEELHNEVWKGRVVSDAAVRRAISKLRACLGHNENDEPYIKSAHKRGYKFNAKLLRVESAHLSPETIKKVFNIPLLLVVGIVIIFLAFTGVRFVIERYAQTAELDTTHPPSFLSSPLLTFHGEKTDLSKSDDGHWLVFAGKNLGFQGFQLFLSNLNTRVTKQLTINEDNIIRVEFSPNNQRLYYINLSIGNASLSTIAFDEQHKIIDKKSLISDYYFLADFALTPDESGIYFTGMRSKSANSQVFYLDLNTLSISEITSGYQNESHDYRISMSNDGATLAIVSIVGDVEQKISLIDAKLHKVKQRFFHEAPLLSVEWLNKNEILLLDKLSLTRLNIETGSRTVVQKPDEVVLNSIDITSAGEVIALTEGDKNNLFIEVDFPSMHISNKKVLTGIADDIVDVKFAGESGKYILLRKEGNTYSLLSQEMSNESKTTIFSSKLPISLQSISRSGDQVLLFLDGLLAILHCNEQQLEYIHSGDRLLATEATFGQSGKNIMFGERTNDGWTIQNIDLVSGQQYKLFEGYYSALEYNNGYLLRDEKGKVYSKSDKTSEAKFLGIEIMIDKRSTWFVRGDVLYWSIHDGITAQFFAKNLVSGEGYNLNFDSSLVSSSFDLNNEGRKAILQSQQLPDSKIVAIRLKQ